MAIGAVRGETLLALEPSRGLVRGRAESEFKILDTSVIIDGRIGRRLRDRIPRRDADRSAVRLRELQTSPDSQDP